MRIACCLALAAAMSFAGLADTDVYGNAILYESDGVGVRYRFWISSDSAEMLSASGSSVRTCECSGGLAASVCSWRYVCSPGEFDARTYTRSSIVGPIDDPWKGFFITVR
ncbi:MAG: hypothetical protein IKK82_13965 [Kiritimatiellae bacterium]|nr:hypothetical protein [Kiritimatiellia bacterium]